MTSTSSNITLNVPNDNFCSIVTTISPWKMNLHLFDKSLIKLPINFLHDCLYNQPDTMGGLSKT